VLIKEKVASVSDTVIRVENLSKKYLISHQQQQGSKALRDKLSGAAQSLVKRLTHPSRSQVESWTCEEFWALRDVSFTLQAGDRLGIIGRNGAGKSTLLKLLSRISEPTAGSISIRGRVSSLLEVGTGFHGELTGRENIYLNGSILGMSKQEIARKFDEIVAFSEVEKFLDTPVKHYSSGMYVRLAFAVAAHLEPEILIVDEVLAVGDAAFQKKCLGKMSKVAQEGRTVLFVSHNMAAVQALCDRSLLLDGGRLVSQGATVKIIHDYLQSSLAEEEIPLAQRSDRLGDGSVTLTSIEIESTEPDKVIYSGSRLKITIGYRSDTRLLHPHFVISIYDTQSNCGIFRLSSSGVNGLPESLPPEGFVTCITDPINVTPGTCFVTLTVKRGPARADYVAHAKSFEVRYQDVDGKTKCPERDWVLTLIPHRWSVEAESSSSSTSLARVTHY
jgi:lipopolysaccharide transport system ATP-binding protein